MIALEMQFAALRTSRRELQLGDLSPIESHIAKLSTRCLPSSIPFSWSKDITRAVWFASQTIPSDAEISEDILPDGLTHCWWWFGNDGLPISVDTSADLHGLDRNRIAGLLLSKRIGSDGHPALDVVDYRMDAHVGPMTWSFVSIPLRIPLSTLMSEPALDPETGKPRTDSSQRSVRIARFLMAAQAWLGQRIIAIGSGGIERPRRKQLSREHAAPLLSDVKVIQLRRSESQSHQSSSESETVEWSCRWIVGGHWRNQPYANGERKLIYIMPFVKGPADMPLKVPTHTVYQVNR